MSNYSLRLENVTRTFGRRLVFNDVNIEYTRPGIYGIAGKNGSGKSTLVKIIAGIISPTRGSVWHTDNDKPVKPEQLHKYIGFISPYLMLYDEFSAWENLEILSKIEGVEYNRERAEYLLNEFALLKRKDDLLGGYSSGMKQRIKFIYAVLKQQPLLILDEPASNLDSEGKEKLYSLINSECSGSITLIASNEESDLKLCSSIVQIEEFKN